MLGRGSMPVAESNGYFRMSCTKISAIGLHKGVLHQETSHGGGLLVGVQLPFFQKWVWLQKHVIKPKSYHLRNANYRGIYIPSQNHEPLLPTTS
jgi:hypothetical protein